MNRALMNFVKLIACILCFFLSPGIALGSMDLYTVFLNGERLDVQPVLKDGAVYLPVQPVASKLQLSVEWNSRLNVVKINDQLVEAVPVVIDGVILLPVESIAQIIHGIVKWDGKKKRIQIDVPQSNILPGSPDAGDSAESSGIKVGPTIKVPKVNDGAGSNVMPIPQASSNSKQQSGGGGSHIVENQSGMDSYPYPSTSAYPGSSLPPGNTGQVTEGGQNASSTQDNSNIYQKKSGLTSDQFPLNQGSGYYTYPQSTAHESLKNTTPEVDPSIYPLHAPPSMPDNLSLPPTGPIYPGSSQNPSVPAEIYSTPMYPQVGNFAPKKEQNGVFSVTVTNIEHLNTIKSYYKPHAGSKYIVVYVTQQNVSEKVQVYTGKFSLVDGENKIYDYQEALSNFWLVILRPGAMNFGYLVFEVPDGAIPTKLVLHALNQEPLTVGLD